MAPWRIPHSRSVSWPLVVIITTGMLGRRIAGDLARCLEAVQTGHDHVHQDEVGQFGPGDAQAFLAGSRGDRLMPGGLQVSGDHMQLRLGIVYNKYFGHRLQAALSA